MTVFPSNWAQQLLDPAHFQAEQRQLAHIWTFLGLSQDLNRDGDWIQASIATRSVFIQRFGTELRGFQNLCAHRFYPIRRARKGNGPIVCGFHNWQYNRDGRVVGIPICNLAYGGPPHTIPASLEQIELAICGSFVFGRFPAKHAKDSLNAYLGDAFPILEAISRFQSRPLYLEQPVAAHWKLNIHITLDDYHGPPVHPTTLGRHGYLPSLGMLRYVRLGANSIYLFSDDERCFERLVEGCRTNTYRSSHFFVLQILPNLIVAHVDADRPFWFCNIMQYLPVAPDRTTYRSWSYPASFASDYSWFHKATRPVTDSFRRPIYMHYFKRVVREDIAVCEHLQKVLPQIERAPLLGTLERRISWFEESLRHLTDNQRPFDS
jgi:phenylpropionate dioxygenase-like ring-hydroxylating dioxygenase large terminal subunit